MKNLFPRHLPGKPNSFKDYLSGVFRNKKRHECQKVGNLRRCSSTTRLQESQLRALVAMSFPPVTVGDMTGRNVPVTFEGDCFPQFSHLEKSNFLCEVCVPYQKWAVENGKPHARLRTQKQASVEGILAGTA